jgi:predicted Zn-dependent protease
LLIALAALSWGGLTLYRHWDYYRHREAASQADKDFDFESERDHLKACVNLRPQDAEARLQLARAARRMDDYVTAQEALDAYGDLKDASEAEEALERTMLAAQQGVLPVAEPLLRRLLAQEHPQSALILEALVKGSLSMYRFDAAQSWNEQLLGMIEGGGNVPALLLQGYILLTMGSSDQAVVRFQSAVGFKPEHVGARLALAEALLNLHRASEAQEVLEHVYKRSQTPEVAFMLARCCRPLQQYERAANLLDDLLRQAPNAPVVLAERGRVAMDMDDLPKAEELLTQAAKHLRDDPQVYRDLGVALTLQGGEKKVAAKEAFKRADQLSQLLAAQSTAISRVRKSPNDPQLRLEVGTLLLKIDTPQKREEALRWFLSAIQVAPEYPPAHEALISYYEQIGQPARAGVHREFLASQAPPGKAPAGP